MFSRVRAPLHPTSAATALVVLRSANSHCARRFPSSGTQAVHTHLSRSASTSSSSASSATCAFARIPRPVLLPESCSRIGTPVTRVCSLKSSIQSPLVSSLRLMSSESAPPATRSLVQRWLAPTPEYTRWSSQWWADKIWICILFGITGSSTMVFAKPMLHDVLGLQGTLAEGPWSYRLAYVGIITPIYSVILMTVGTLGGRHHFFKQVLLRMWGRFIPGLRNPASKPSAAAKQAKE